MGECNDQSKKTRLEEGDGDPDDQHERTENGRFQNFLMFALNIHLI